MSVPSGGVDKMWTFGSQKDDFTALGVYSCLLLTVKLCMNYLHHPTVLSLMFLVAIMKKNIYIADLLMTQGVVKNPKMVPVPRSCWSFFILLNLQLGGEKKSKSPGGHFFHPQRKHLGTGPKAGLGVTLRIFSNPSPSCCPAKSALLQIKSEPSYRSHGVILVDLCSISLFVPSKHAGLQPHQSFSRK